jgi:hypothetical protein
MKATVKPVCNLSNCDGNVFMLAGRVSKALKRAGLADKVTEFQGKLTTCKSYDEALQLMMAYVEVE